MTALTFDIPALASRIANEARYQATAMVRTGSKVCDCCRRVRHGNTFDERATTCRQCVKASQKVMPSCHPMLMAKWGTCGE